MYRREVSATEPMLGKALMRHDRSGLSIRARWVSLFIVVTLSVAAASAAQSVEGVDTEPASLAVAAAQQVTAADGQERPTYPWDDRPKCASMFLKSDWQLTPKQRACDWMNNHLFATSRVFSTLWSAGYSVVTDRPSESGDAFGVRFGRKWLQGAMATSGEYLGAEIAREDPRGHPPYLVLRNDPRPHGFFNRFAAAIQRNVVSSRCFRKDDGKTDPNDIGRCLEPKDIHKRFRLSRLLGSFASGTGGVLMNWDEPDRRKRAWNGIASSYASSFATEVFSEFKPELSAVLGSVLRRLGVR
jgi:hypothetical protein